MAKEGSGKNPVRIILWAVATILSIASLGIFVLTYRTMEQATLFSEKSAVDLSRSFRYYADEYKVVKVALDEANQKLVLLTQELEAANAELTTARGELSTVQQMNDQLKTDIASLERYRLKAMEKGEALESMIAAFKGMNKELDMELQGVRKELSSFQPDINDVNEGRSKIKLFKRQLRLIRQNMGVIKHRAYEIKVSAQKEGDRLETLYGNAGYLVKDGENRSVTKFDDKVVDIDVRFVNP